MNNDTTINKHFLMSHFAGHSTPIQKALLEDWLRENENMELYYECLEDWEKENLQFTADEAATLKKIFSDQPVKEQSVSPTLNVFSLWKKMAAAAIIILCLGGALFFERHALFYKTVATTNGEVKQLELPDGSMVTLNANTSISYARFGFNNKRREVTINGEAEFSVVHTKSNQQFAVKGSNNLEVLVLGTQFNVYNRNEKAQVALKRGKISLVYNNNNNPAAYVLKPGDVFTQNNQSEKATVEHKNNSEVLEVLTAWKNHDYAFDGTPLSQVASLLKDDFGVQIQFKDVAIASKKISGSFHAEKAEELVDAIAQILGINYKVVDKTIYFFD